jgi:mycoredoxin-dependent peroxiredoxin
VDVRNHADEFAAAGARVIAVSCDAMFTLRAFADQEGLAFDLVSDHWPHGAIADSYGVFDEQLGCALRGSFILDSEGKIIWQVVNQIGNGRQVADALRSLAV